MGTVVRGGVVSEIDIEIGGIGFEVIVEIHVKNVTYCIKIRLNCNQILFYPI